MKEFIKQKQEEAKKKLEQKFFVKNGELSVEKYVELEDHQDLLIADTVKATLKHLITEYQENELDGKSYDFYFSIRDKIDKLNELN